MSSQNTSRPHLFVSEIVKLHVSYVEALWPVRPAYPTWHLLQYTFSSIPDCNLAVDMIIFCSSIWSLSNNWAHEILWVEYTEHVESCTTVLEISLSCVATFRLTIVLACLWEASAYLCPEDLLWWILKGFGSLSPFIHETGRLRLTPLALHTCRPYKSPSFGGVGYANGDGDGDAHCPLLRRHEIEWYETNLAVTCQHPSQIKIVQFVPQMSVTMFTVCVCKLSNCINLPFDTPPSRPFTVQSVDISHF
jgi:hypothetical protein